jgi:AraC-like DNA-binding protein
MIRPADAQFTITGRGRFEGSVARIDLDHLRMQRGVERMPRIWHVDVPSDRFALAFLADDGGEFGWRGIRAGPREVAVCAPGTRTVHALFGPAEWGSISLPAERIAMLGIALLGRSLQRRDVVTINVPASALTALRRCHTAAADLARTAPEILANPEVARGLEQCLTDAMLRCLAPTDVRGETVTQLRRSNIVKRFRALADEHADRPLYLSEVCSTIGVPARTLNECCREQLGISPKHYLILRRLHLARRALRYPAVSGETVTRVAMQFGFWDLGRFAGYYKDLFGESPSATLHRAATRSVRFAENA